MSKSKTVIGLMVTLGALWMGGCAANSHARDFSDQAVAEWRMRTEHDRQLQSILSEPARGMVERDEAPNARPADVTFAGVW